MAKVLIFPCVHVYEARNSYWPGKILKGISGGASLYQTRHEDRPWGFKIHTNEETEAPHAVEFENGVLWGFCCMSERLRTVEWPRFLADYFERGDRMRCSARVENLFSDSMHLTLVSEPIDRELRRAAARFAHLASLSSRAATVTRIFKQAPFSCCD